jgi:hypothetical protein
MAEGRGVWNVGGAQIWPETWANGGGEEMRREREKEIAGDGAGQKRKGIYCSSRERFARQRDAQSHCHGGVSVIPASGQDPFQQTLIHHLPTEQLNDPNETFQ